MTLERSARDQLSALAADQSGLFTRQQALASGYSSYQVRQRLRSGQWHQVLGGVLTAHAVGPTHGLRDRAALLAIDGAALAGPSAARRHGIATPDHHTYVAVDADYHHNLPGVRLLRGRVSDSDLTTINGVLLTSRDRTVVDCLRVLAEREAVEFLEHSLQAGWITPDALADRVHRFAGQHGAKRLAHLSRIAGSGAHSAAERVALAVLRRARLSGWQANVAIHDELGLVGVGDVVFEEERLVLEIDGRAYHVTPDTFQRDRQRQNRLVAAGWNVLRFTWHDLTQRPDYVVATIRTMLNGRFR
jgi:very-short-patch-repair endonuclease